MLSPVCLLIQNSLLGQFEQQPLSIHLGKVLSSTVVWKPVIAVLEHLGNNAPQQTCRTSTELTKGATSITKHALNTRSGKETAS